METITADNDRDMHAMAMFRVQAPTAAGALLLVEDNWRTTIWKDGAVLYHKVQPGEESGTFDVIVAFSPRPL